MTDCSHREVPGHDLRRAASLLAAEATAAAALPPMLFRLGLVPLLLLLCRRRSAAGATVTVASSCSAALPDITVTLTGVVATLSLGSNPPQYNRPGGADSAVSSTGECLGVPASKC